MNSHEDKITGKYIKNSNIIPLKFTTTFLKKKKNFSDNKLS